MTHLKNKKILVTGGSGFIGLNVKALLIEVVQIYLLRLIHLDLITMMTYFRMNMLLF